jgi:hypothetical protein
MPAKKKPWLKIRKPEPKPQPKSQPKSQPEPKTSSEKAAVKEGIKVEPKTSPEKAALKESTGEGSVSEKQRYEDIPVVHGVKQTPAVWPDYQEGKQAAPEAGKPKHVFPYGKEGQFPKELRPESWRELHERELQEAADRQGTTKADLKKQTEKEHKRAKLEHSEKGQQS